MTRKILMIATDWNDGNRDGKYGGVTHYRLQLPKLYMESLGYEVDLFGKGLSSHIYKGVKDKNDPEELKRAYRNFVIQYDAVISKVIDNQLGALFLIDACRQTRTKLIIDLDDNFLEVTPDQPAYQKGYHPGGESRGNATAFISMADALFCSTKPLASYYTKFLKDKFKIDMPTYVLENGHDPNIWKHKKKTNKVIGWAGSVTHVHDLRMAMPAIYRVMKERPEYTFELIGGFTEKSFKDKFNPPTWFKKRLNIVHGTSGFTGYPEMMSKLDWTLGLAPIVDNEFNRAKSHIKWQEYGLVGIPTVASDVYPYRTKITHGENGFLAKHDNWYETINEALNSDLTNVVQNVKESLKDLDIFVTGEQWINAIDSVV